MNRKNDFSWVNPDCVVKRSSVHGKGVFAKRRIQKGFIICVFGGKVFTVGEVRNIEKISPKRGEYILKLADGFYSGIPNFGIKFETADRINHSCDPNCGFVGQVTLVALRDIEKGEEITYDYAMCDDDPEDHFKCNCGSVNCRHKVTGDDWKNPQLQIGYVGYFTPYIQSLIDKIR